MKLKIIQVILALSLAMWGLVFQTAFAAETSASYSLSADAEAKVDGTVKITVNGRDMKDVFGYQIVLSFDTAKLEFKGAKNALPKTSEKEMDGMVAAQSVNGNQVTFAYSKAGFPGVSGNEPIAVFEFSAKESGEATVELQSINITYTNDAYDKLTPSEQAKIMIRSSGSGHSGGSTSEDTDNNTNDPVSHGSAGRDNNRNVKAEQGNITVVTPVSETGGAELELRADELLQALQSVNDGTFQINMQVESGKKLVSTAVTLPVQDILQQSKIEKLIINTGLAKVTIPTGAEAGILTAGSKSLTLNVSTLNSSSLPESVRDLVQDAPVYDFTLSIDGNRVSRFNSSAVTVEIPYTLKNGEKPHQIVMYYISDDGKLEVVKNAKYNPQNGTVSFHPPHFSKYTPVSVKITFNDLTNVDWAKESIEALASREMIDGTGNGSFQPETQVTRAEFIKMLINAFDLNDAQATSSLRDVKEGEWYYRAIASAQKLGIAEGRADGSFGLNDPITRQDMAVLVHRAALLVKADLTPAFGEAKFADRSEIAPYAGDAVSAMQQAGVIEGLQAGVFGPQGAATRAEAATIIYRIYNKIK